MRHKFNLLLKEESSLDEGNNSSLSGYDAEKSRGLGFCEFESIKRDLRALHLLTKFQSSSIW